MCVCCEGDGNAGVWSGGDVVTVIVCMSGTHGSGVLSSTGDVLEMSVVRGVGGVCDMCVCLARGGVDEKIGWGGDREGVGRESVFWLRWCRWGVGRGLGPGLRAVGWCYICVRCESVVGRSRYLCIVLGGYLHI